MHFQISLLQYTYHVTIVSSFCHQFLPRSSVAMSAAASSFQTLLAPWETIIEFRTNLNKCRQSLQLLSQAVPNVLPAAREWIVMAKQLLDRIEPELQRIEHQPLCILQLQFSDWPPPTTGRRLTLLFAVWATVPTHPCGCEANQ